MKPTIDSHVKFPHSCQPIQCQSEILSIIHVKTTDYWYEKIKESPCSFHTSMKLTHDKSVKYLKWKS